MLIFRDLETVHADGLQGSQMIFWFLGGRVGGVGGGRDGCGGVCRLL